MNIFSSLKKYKDKWEETDVRSFEPDEINGISHAKVIDSEYGHSVCFYCKGGGKYYIPLDKDSTLSTGDIVDLHTAKIVTLSRDGDADIYRIRE